jgi:ATP synthase protein I
MRKKDDYKWHFEILRLSSYIGNIGFVVIFCILLFFMAGYYLDKWLHTHGVFLILGILIGVVTGGWSAFRIITDIDKKFGPHEKRQEDNKEVDKNK